MNEDQWFSTEGTQPKEALENFQGVHVNRIYSSKILYMKMYLLIHCI